MRAALTVFVYARRRQRAIPELEPVKNTSKEFAETIGRLYFFKGDHTDLAKKMCLYFKDELRQRLYLRRSVWDDETIEHVAGRTGIPSPFLLLLMGQPEHHQTGTTPSPPRGLCRASLTLANR